MILSFNGMTPDVDDTAWVAENATVIGNVRVGAGAIVLYGAVVRGDGDSITIGENTNVQDNCIVHADPGQPAAIGSGVSVGHGAIVHSATVEDDVIVGMRSTVLSDAVVGRESIIGAGSVVTEGKVIPPRSLVLGIPGRVVRELSDEEVAGIRQNAQNYLDWREHHRSAN